VRFVPLQHTLTATRCPGLPRPYGDPASAFHVLPTRAASVRPFWRNVSPVRFYADQRSKALSLDAVDVRVVGRSFAVIVTRRVNPAAK
jgi:hypothetical protein